jgi:hypothetical protein
MKKLLITTVALALTMLVAGTAEAARPCRYYTQVYVQPAAVAAPVAPAPVTAARAEAGYRAFSYQPTTNVGVNVRTYRARPAQPGFLNAGTKALGKY